MIFVTKADGSKQPFDKNKIVRTCLRLGLTNEQAEEVASKIEKQAYDGIPTKKILQLVFKFAGSYREAIKHQIDLRKSISLLRPKPDFEKFIGIVFEILGYKTQTNLILEGKCIEHEIDAVAIKDNEIILVEVKHHENFHKYTGLDVFLEVNSTLEDLREGYSLGKHSYNFSKAIVVCNTKISDHAKKYAQCRKIEAIAWRYPEEFGLERIIEENKIYPITLLKEINIEEVYKIADAGILTLKQLLDDAKIISSKTKIPVKRIKELQEEAKAVLEIKF